ncbi:hypothetical protein KR074_004728, partial [Drosophila pseudoananassae]
SKMTPEFADYLERDKQSVIEIAPDGCREHYLWIYEKTRITAEELARPFSREEAEELCRRTKVKVKMYRKNCVFEAKKRFEAKGRFKDASQRYIDKMLIKAVKRKMVTPYSDEEVSKWRSINRSLLKEQNLRRLEIWRQSRRSLSRESKSSHKSNFTNDNISDVELMPSQSKEDYDYNSEMLLQDICQSQSQNQDTGDVQSQELGIGPSEEIHPSILNLDWVQAGIELNSESILDEKNTQSQRSDDTNYEIFGTQVVGASTQDTAS